MAALRRTRARTGNPVRARIVRDQLAVMQVASDACRAWAAALSLAKIAFIRSFVKVAVILESMQASPAAGAPAAELWISFFSDAMIVAPPFVQSNMALTSLDASAAESFALPK